MHIKREDLVVIITGDDAEPVVTVMLPDED